MMSSPKCVLLITCSCAPDEWTAECCAWPVVWWSASQSAAGASRHYCQLCQSNTPHPKPPLTLPNTLYWSLAVIDLIFSGTAQQCPTFLHLQPVLTGLLSACGLPLNSMHCLTLSAGMVGLCLTVSPSSPPAVNKPTWLQSLTLCCMHLLRVLSMAYYVCGRTNPKTSFRISLPVSHYKTGKPVTV